AAAAAAAAAASAKPRRRGRGGGAGGGGATTSTPTKPRGRPPLSHRGKRLAKARAPQLVETGRSAVLLKGASTSATVNGALTEVASLLKPAAKKLTRKNPLLPFEAGGEAHVCSLARLNDASAFLVGSHTKKRPHHLTLGRTFDGHVLDMVELRVAALVPMVAFRRAGASAVAPETKACLLFQGDDWGRSPAATHLRSLLLDTFRGPLVGAVNLAGLDRLLVFTLAPPEAGAADAGGAAAATTAAAAAAAAAAAGKEPPLRVRMRHYAIRLVKASAAAAAATGDGGGGGGAGGGPAVALSELGPRLDLVSGRAQWASDDLRRAAVKGPRHPGTARKIKNVSYDAGGLGDTRGRLHVDKQDLGELALT
ncbi:hypothetical protein BU14_3072s0001, partial [Porphyra umbilicalis]